eukprot:scaffold89044_cov67-Attheya_sp.AAC.2
MVTPFRHMSPHMIARVLVTVVLGGVDNIWIKPGSKVLYIGAAAGTSVSHVSDIVGSTGIVYTVEFLAQPDLARIVALNSHYVLKNGGHAVNSTRHPALIPRLYPRPYFEGKSPNDKRNILNTMNSSPSNHTNMTIMPSLLPNTDP